MLTAPYEGYGYNHQNQRLWRFSPVLGQNTEYYFYGAMGELLGAYELRNGAGDYFTEKWVKHLLCGAVDSLEDES
jgi:hypothetical protein